MCVCSPFDVVKFQDTKVIGGGMESSLILPKAKAQKPKKTGDETPTPDEEPNAPVPSDHTRWEAGNEEYEDDDDNDDDDDDDDDDDGEEDEDDEEGESQWRFWRRSSDDGHDGGDDDGENNNYEERESEYCPFCRSLNYWVAMDVCWHHIGMEFDGVPKSKKLKRLVRVWMSLAGKLDILGIFNPKKWTEISGTSTKTIRLFLQNVDEGHELDLNPEDDLADIFGLRWGGTICQSQGMLGVSVTSIFCKNPYSLEEHVKNLEKLNKFLEREITPEEEQ